MGNYTYGYIGAALGVPLGLLKTGSFGAHVMGNGMDAFKLEKLGNEFNDWDEIEKGYNAYRR